MTWIGSFGIWEDDFIAIEDKFAGCDIQFWQTIQLIALSVKNRKTIIFPGRMVFVQNVTKKDFGYGVYNVFISNYLGLLMRCVENEQLSKKVFALEERRLFFGYFTDHFINLVLTPSRYNKNGWTGVNIFFKYYVKKRYFVLFLANFIYRIFYRAYKKYLN